MARNIINNPKYCKKGSKRKSYDFADGTKLYGCKRGWSIFFATLNKQGWSDTKPRPKKVSESTVMMAIAETVYDMVKYYFSETSPAFIKWYEARKKKQKKKVKNKGKIPKSEITAKKRKPKTCGGTYGDYPSGRGHSFVPKGFAHTNKTLTKGDVKGTIPKWVTMARTLLKSSRGNKKLRDYWSKRLKEWEGKQK